MNPLLHGVADANQVRQLQAIESLRQIAQQENRQPVRLAQVGGDLRQVSVGSQPYRTAQRISHGAERLLNIDSDGGGVGKGTFPPHQPARHLVHRHDIGDWDTGIDGLDDAVVILDVKFGPRLDKLNVRAPLLGLFHVDARLDAVSLGFIRGGDTASVLGDEGGQCRLGDPSIPGAPVARPKRSTSSGQGRATPRWEPNLP